MGITGLFALLLMIFGNLTPAKAVPLQPICDSRVMDTFITEAKKAEQDMDRCTTSCEFEQELYLPDTKVNFEKWNAMDRKTQAEEVWNGLALFKSAMSQVRELVTGNTITYSVDKTYSNIRSITKILERLNIKNLPVQALCRRR
ncbi:erythropoietin isoform X2 [Ambystoma mexicanum]|uniref:erythropoietin isoform X2 n=1 Tax=Ambystoma mexicanum TaxID=8296 RepID=UPI0037E70C0A